MEQKKKFIIYYAIILILVIVGFVVGCKSYSLDNGYRVFYGTGESRKFVDVGNKTDYKYIQFYNITLTGIETYFNNDKELSLDNIINIATDRATPSHTEQNEIVKNIMLDKKIGRTEIHWGNIILTLFIIIILAIAPIVLKKVKQLKNKK